jgi:hypothetical protein
VDANEATSPISSSTSTLTSAVCSTSAFTSSKSPQNQSPTSDDLPRDRCAPSRHPDSSHFLRRERFAPTAPPSLLGRCSTVSLAATKKPLFAAASSSWKSPLTDSNRRPPPYYRGLEVGKQGQERVSAGTKIPQTEGVSRKGVTARGRACPPLCSLHVPSVIEGLGSRSGGHEAVRLGTREGANFE